MWKTITTIVSIVQIIVSIVLIASVLMQSAKKEGMAGIVGGASETFFGKNKGRTLDSKFAAVTTACAILFLISSLVLSYGFVAVENQNAKSQEEVNTETTDDITVVPEATVPNDMVDITAPEGTETAPEATETAPEGTAAPEGTETAPEGTETAPEGTETAPEGTAAPENTEAVPAE